MGRMQTNATARLDCSQARNFFFAEVPVSLFYSHTSYLINNENSLYKKKYSKLSKNQIVIDRLIIYF